VSQGVSTYSIKYDHGWSSIGLQAWTSSGFINTTVPALTWN